jgi:hypothetical protein
MKILPALFMLFLAISNAFAETNDTVTSVQEYDVNVIIFEDAHARYINSETWNQNNTTDPETSSESSSSQATTDNLDKLSLKETDKTSFKTIKPTILTKEYQRIKKSSEYNILFYGAWRQAGLSDTEAFEINIDDLDNKDKSTSHNTITGNFKLILARYLHFYADLEYHREGNNDASSTSPASDAGQNNSSDNNLSTENKTYPIAIHRRMRSKELHYIDHPLVGMLIQINPVEKAKETTQ